MLTRLICSRHAEANRLCKTMALRRHFRDRAVSARLQKNRSSPRRDTRAAISLVRSLWIRWPGLSRRWMCLRRTCSSFQTAARQGPRAMRIVRHRPRCSTFTVDRRQPEADTRFAVACDTLAVRLTLSLAGCVEDSHLQARAPCRAHTKKGAAECRALCSHR